jgi:hypothetical protein
MILCQENTSFYVYDDLNFENFSLAIESTQSKLSKSIILSRKNYLFISFILM